MDSDENWAYADDNHVDRAGVYGPLFPPGLKVGETLSVYYDDPAKAFDVTVVEEIDDWNQLGITVVKIDASRPSAPYDPEAAEVLLMRGRGLPTQVSLNQVKAALKLNLNISSSVSLPFGQSVPTSGAIPEAAKAAVAQIQEVVDAHPLTIAYSQESSDFYYIEQVTGATVGVTFDRTTSINIDTSVAQAVNDLLGGYTTLPLVGSKIAAALARVDEVADSYRDPYAAFSQKITMTDASQAEMAQTAKEKISAYELGHLPHPGDSRSGGGAASGAGSAGGSAGAQEEGCLAPLTGAPSAYPVHIHSPLRLSLCLRCPLSHRDRHLPSRLEPVDESFDCETQQP